MPWGRRSVCFICLVVASAGLLPAQKPTAEAYYTQGVDAWSKWYPAYAEARTQLGMKPDDPGPMPAGNVKADLKLKYLPTLEQGLNALKRALAINPRYDDAMIYLSLLVRQRAVLRDTKAEYDGDCATADEWVHKAAEVNWPMPHVRRRNAVHEARLITKVDPVYPLVTRVSHIAGVVDLQFVIDKTGQVKDIKVIGGNPLLRPAAIEAVNQWLYVPGSANGEPVAVVGSATIKFPPGKEQ